jgi:DNA-binding LytR/AlgR family response regulator
MNVLLVEDEPLALAALLDATTSFSRDVRIAGQAGSVREALAWLDTHGDPDLVIADVRLSDGTSLDLFEARPVACPVIFATAYDVHVLDALEHNGIAYVLKPIERDRLHAALRKYQALGAHFAERPRAATLASLRAGPAGYRRRVVGKRGLDFVSIPVEEAAWFVSEHKLTFLVDRAAHRWLVDRPLGDLAFELDPARFFRATRQVLVQIDSVRSFRPAGRGRLSLVLEPPAAAEVIVSQEQANVFRAWVGG